MYTAYTLTFEPTWDMHPVKLEFLTGGARTLLVLWTQLTLVSYRILFIVIAILGALTNGLVLLGFWKSDRSKMTPSMVYIANHTTLEQTIHFLTAEFRDCYFPSYKEVKSCLKINQQQQSKVSSDVSRTISQDQDRQQLVSRRLETKSKARATVTLNEIQS